MAQTPFGPFPTPTVCFNTFYPKIVGLAAANSLLLLFFKMLIYRTIIP